MQNWTILASWLIIDSQQKAHWDGPHPVSQNYSHKCQGNTYPTTKKSITPLSDGL